MKNGCVHPFRVLIVHVRWSTFESRESVHLDLCGRLRVGTSHPRLKKIFTRTLLHLGMSEAFPG